MIYEIYLQVMRTSRTHAHVPVWPGCNWLADTPDVAMEQAVVAISWHLGLAAQIWQISATTG